ncbi:hypothetical protein LCGC14_3136580, partial [marine sediment metagenome]
MAKEIQYRTKMRSSKKFRRVFSKIFAIAEKNVRTQIRFKYYMIWKWILPVLTLLVPMMIMSEFFEYSQNIGPWTPQNFMIFIF